MDPREGSVPMRGSKEPLRVLHLHSGNMIGGIETMLLTLAEHSPQVPELQQSFALTFDASFAAQLRALHTTVHLLPQPRLRHLPSIAQARRQLRMLLKESPPDAVISHSTWIQLIFGDVLHDHEIPVVFWMHDAFSGHWLQKLASFHPPDFAVCNSQWTRSSLHRCYNVPSAVLSNPINPLIRSADREEVRRSLEIPRDEVVIVMAARMQSWKGQANLLRAARRLSTREPWRILFAGGSNSPEEAIYVQSLQQLARDYGIEARVQFLGFRSDVPALLAASDIFCHPNQKPEPYGLVFLEALQAGVPVVTYAMGGVREILDTSVAILAAPGDIDGIATGLAKLIDDAEVRTRLGMAGPEWAQRFHPIRQMRALTDMIRTTIAHKTGANR